MSQPLYDIGDEVQVEDENGWWKVVNVFTYIDKSEKGTEVTITYGVEQDVFYLEVELDEIIASKKGKVIEIALPLEERIDILLYNLKGFKDLGEPFKEEYEACLAELRELTKAGDSD